jgi:hypothetical protein
VHGIDALRKSFDEFAWRLPFDALPVIRDQGLVLGYGTVLTRMGRNRRGEDSLALDADEERFLALLSAVCGRQISPRVMHHVSRASEQWRRGDKVLAQIELAFARFPRLETRDDAFRLFLAEDLLARGFSPRRLARELGFDTGLLKYSDKELRNPSGEGKLSGEWVRVEGDPQEGATSFDIWRTPRRAFDFLRRIPPGTLTELAVFATRFSVATIYFEAIFIPTPNSGGIREGDVPGLPGVGYRRDGAALDLDITATADDGSKVKVECHRVDNSLYVDERNRPVGRLLSGSLYLDVDAVTAAIRDEIEQKPKADVYADPRIATHSDEPKLCPAPSLDQGEKKDTDKSGKDEFAAIYQEYVGTVVNPHTKDIPVPAELGFALFNPLSSKSVVFDHCRESNGDMIEAKGHYETVLGFPKGRENLEEEWLAQATRQIEAADANGGRGIEWHFYEEASMEFAREIFKIAGLGDRIKLVHTEYPGNDEWPYPESVRRTWAKGRQKP